MKHLRPLALGLFLCLAAESSVSTRAHGPAEGMAEAARNFLAALSPEQREQAAFEFKDDERLNWHFIPRERKGLSLGEMQAEQRALAHGLLSTGLSQRGYVTSVTIMSLEKVLQDLEGAGRRFSRDPALYFVSIFGEPAAHGTWGWRVEGHHLAVNFTVIEGEHIAGTPSFFGANPAEVRQGPRKGLRALAEEEDLARKLLGSLNAEQREKAVISETAPRDVITGADREAKPLEDVGVSASDLTASQKATLHQLVRVYLERNRPELAEAALDAISEAGWSNVRFAWAGSAQRGQGHYYRVQGPTFLLEYDNTQNEANHIHAVWRDFDGDFGRDLLKEHYDAVRHDR